MIFRLRKRMVQTWMFSSIFQMPSISLRNIFLCVFLAGLNGMAGESVTNQNEAKLIASGKTQVEIGKWDDAIELFQRALELNPTNNLILELKGTAYFAKGSFGKAVEDYTEAIRLGSQNASIFQNRANAFRAVKDYDKALADLNRSLHLNPTNPVALATRASVHAAKGDLLKAIEDSTEALYFAPENLIMLKQRGYYYYNMREIDNALLDWQNVLRLSPTDQDLLNTVSWIFATSPSPTRRNGKEALKLATRACEATAWSSWGCLDTLAAAYAENGNYKEAVKIQNQALNMVGVSEDHLKSMRKRLLLYENQKAYRE